MARRTLAISLHVEGRRVVVVGQGVMARERVARLEGAGAQVTAVGEAAYQPSQLTGAWVVMLCDEDKSVALAERIGADARAARALFYAQDRPALSDFAMPALVVRGPVRIAIGTEGRAPALARRLREELERVLDHRLADFAGRIAEDRGKSSQVVAGLRLDGKLILPDLE